MPLWPGISAVAAAVGKTRIISPNPWRPCKQSGPNASWLPTRSL